MACYDPRPAFKDKSGSVRMLEKGTAVANLVLACGRCIGCRVERARQWSERVMHEASMFPENCFLTLTYRDENLPAHGSLVYAHFQKFMRELRKATHPKRVRFFMCGEYGIKKGRPHYHAAIFNHAFLSDRVYLRLSDSGDRIFTSPTLGRIWPSGKSEIGALNKDTANYVASYIVDKHFGQDADEWYKVVDQSTGEVVWLEPEFVHMSLKPGIGADWFAKYFSDVFPNDKVISSLGFEGKPPRYYDKLLKKRCAAMFEDVKARRLVEGKLYRHENTFRRLKVRERVASARLSTKKRTIK